MMLSRTIKQPTKNRIKGKQIDGIEIIISFLKLNFPTLKKVHFLYSFFKGQVPTIGGKVELYIYIINNAI